MYWEVYCAGVYWEVCGLVCGTLSGRAAEVAALAARRSRAPFPQLGAECSSGGGTPDLAGARRMRQLVTTPEALLKATP